MLDCFSCLTPAWLQRAHVYTGSVGLPGNDFRFRLAMDGKEKTVHAAAYSKVCFELASDVRQRDFSWDEDGTAALREWLQAEYDAFIGDAQ